MTNWTPQEMGRKGGRKSRRTLSPEAARQMVQVREYRRALLRQQTIDAYPLGVWFECDWNPIEEKDPCQKCGVIPDKMYFRRTDPENMAGDYWCRECAGIIEQFSRNADSYKKQSPPGSGGNPS